MNRVKILYIEDDMTAAKYIVEFLTGYGFEVEHTDSISSGISFLNQKEFDLLLLDLDLPDFDGFELLKSDESSSLPIIVISAIADTTTKIRAFRYGANDYMVKPIDLLELEARIWAHLSRCSKVCVPKKDKDKRDIFRIKNSQLYFQTKAIDLTPIEFEIFQILLKNKNKTVTREILTETLSSVSSHRALDYHIKNIRSKIEKESKNPRYLKTQYGVGYKLTI